jgi:hypothetical protein
MSIAASIEKTKTVIAENIANGKTDQAAVDNLCKVLDLDWDEYVKFQEIKSLAVADGSLCLEDGQTIYGILGEAGPDNFNAQSIEVKVVLTQIFQMLLGKYMLAVS